MEHKTDEQWADYLEDAWAKFCIKCDTYFREKMQEYSQGEFNVDDDIDEVDVSSLNCERDIYRDMTKVCRSNKDVHYMLACFASRAYGFDLFDE